MMLYSCTDNMATVGVKAGPSSAFEKWSGHVEPKGSRMGVFWDIPEKKLDSPFPEAIL